MKCSMSQVQRENDDQQAIEVQQILLKCQSLNRQNGPLSLIQAITSLYLDRHSAEQLAQVKFAAKVDKNRQALRVYL